MSPEDVVVPKQCKDRIIALETALDGLQEREATIKSNMQGFVNAMTALEAKVAGVQSCTKVFERIPEELLSVTAAMQRLDVQVTAFDGRFAGISTDWQDKVTVLETASAKNGDSVNGLEQALTTLSERVRQTLGPLESSRERDHQMIASLVKRVDALEAAQEELQQGIRKKADAAKVPTMEAWSDLDSALRGHLQSTTAALAAKADVGGVPRREEMQMLAQQLQEKADVTSVPSHKQMRALLEEALQYKADASGVASKDQVRALTEALERKADIESVASIKQMQDVAEALKHKADCFAVPTHDQFRSLADTLKSKANADAVASKDDLMAITTSLNQKAVAADVLSPDEVCSLAEKAAKATLKNVTLEKKDIDALIEVLGRKADLDKVVSREEVDGMVNLAVQAATQNGNIDKKSIDALFDDLGRKADMDKVVTRNEVDGMVISTVNEMTKLLKNKADSDVVPTRAEVRAIVEALKGKADKEAVATVPQLQAVEAEVRRKADIESLPNAASFATRVEVDHLSAKLLESLPKTASLATRVELDHLAAQVLKKADSTVAFTMEDAQATIKAIKAYFCPKAEAQNLASKTDLEAGLNAVNEKVEHLEGLWKEARLPKQQEHKEQTPEKGQVLVEVLEAPEPAPTDHAVEKNTPSPPAATQASADPCNQSAQLGVQRPHFPKLSRSRSSAKVVDEVKNTQECPELPRNRSSATNAQAGPQAKKQKETCHDVGVPMDLSAYAAYAGPASACKREETCPTVEVAPRPTGEGLLKRRRKQNNPETPRRVALAPTSSPLLSGTPMARVFH